MNIKELLDDVDFLIKVIVFIIVSTVFLEIMIVYYEHFIPDEFKPLVYPILYLFAISGVFTVIKFMIVWMKKDVIKKDEE